MSKTKAEENKDIQADSSCENINSGTDTTENNEAENCSETEKTGEQEAKTSEAEQNSVEQELEELKDKYLRTVAEFENYKRRTLKEKTELILNGGEKTISSILPIIDDMERAILNAEKLEDKQTVEEGWELIYKKLVNTLESQGVKKIEVDNKDFNVDYHEAIAMVPGAGDDKKGKIIDCVQTGYMLNDKVIRHAKVAVGE